MTCEYSSVFSLYAVILTGYGLFVYLYCKIQTLSSHVVQVERVAEPCYLTYVALLYHHLQFRAL